MTFEKYDQNSALDFQTNPAPLTLCHQVLFAAGFKHHFPAFFLPVFDGCPNTLPQSHFPAWEQRRIRLWVGTNEGLAHLDRGRWHRFIPGILPGCLVADVADQEAPGPPGTAGPQHLVALDSPCNLRVFGATAAQV